MKPQNCIPCFLALCQVIVATPSPNYPSTYTIDGVFSLPYGNVHQPIRLAVDGVRELQSVQYYGGIDGYIYDLNSGMSTEVFIKKDEQVCQKAEFAKKINLKTSRPELQIDFLPNLDDFTYDGKHTCPRTPTTTIREMCHSWTQIETHYGRKNTYTFITKDNSHFSPVMYTMVGYDKPFSSHYEFYELTFLKFTNYINATDFKEPAGCVHTDQEDIVAKHIENVEELHHLFNGVDHVAHKFQEYIQKFGKSYSAEDYETYNKKHENFRKNKALVNEMNRKGDSAIYGLNHVADEDLKELYKKRKCYNQSVFPKNATKSSQYHIMSGKELPLSVDWRISGAVSPVKTQGTCGSCWAFASTEAVESSWFLATGQNVILSPQNLVDCSWKYGNLGCDGGDEAPSFQFVIDNKGMMAEKDYPYTSQDGYCHFDESKVAATVSSYKLIPHGDELSLQDAVATHGPVAIAYDASLPTMTFYSSGIYHDPKCSSENLDHAVIVIGYGVSDSGEEYWIVKNSWSTYYGDMGYFKLARNKGNVCGVASSANYPIV